MSTQLIRVIFFTTLVMVESYGCDLNEVWKCNGNKYPIGYNPVLCVIKHDARCVCKTNYVRDTDGSCQPKKCPANSSFKTCEKIYEHQCIGPITTNTNGQSAADCVCDPGYYWFNEFKGCMTLAKLLETYATESRPRLG